jgi:hypothetical protein
MKRFTAHPRRLARRRLVALAALAIPLSLVLGHTVWRGWNPPQATTMSANSASNAANIHIYYTGRTWAGEPLYQLKNDGATALQRISVSSWSESLLPVLYIGKQLPRDIDRLRPLASPPYTVPSNHSLWFVGPASAASNKFSVVWQVDGHDEYVSLKAQGGA